MKTLSFLIGGLVGSFLTFALAYFIFLYQPRARFIDLPEEFPIAEKGDILIVEKADCDTLRLGFWRELNPMERNAGTTSKNQ